MAHCTQCGSPLPPGASFCTRCGARAAAPAHQPAAGQAPPGAYPPPPPAAKGAGIGKILLIIGGVFILIGVLAIGGLIATGFWIKKKVETAAGNMGLSSAPAPASPAKRYSDPCALLSAAEASSAAGLAIQRAEPRDGECLYFGADGQAAEKGQAQAQEALRKMRENKDSDEKEAARVMEDFMKGIAASSQASEGGPLFHIKVIYGEDAKQQESGYRLAIGMVGAVAGAEEGTSKPSGLEGVGDRAYLAPLATGLYMRKGDAWVEIGGAGLARRDALIALARAVAAKL